jgi:hypothetical protein
MSADFLMSRHCVAANDDFGSLLVSNAIDVLWTQQIQGPSSTTTAAGQDASSLP